MLSVANKPFMLSVIMLNVVMLNVVAPLKTADMSKRLAGCRFFINETYLLVSAKVFPVNQGINFTGGLSHEVFDAPYVSSARTLFSINSSFHNLPLP